jgi:hypothetical protein
MRELLATLRNATGNLPSNMEFAAQSLTEHTENVVVKAKADIEALMVRATQNGVAIEAGDLPVLEIEG